VPLAATVKTDKAADSNSKHKRKPKSKSKDKAAKGQTFGLDGSWDEPLPSLSPAAEGTKPQQDPWDDIPIPTFTAKDLNDESHASASNLPLVKDESNMGAIQMTSANEGIYQPVNGSKKDKPEAGSQASSSKGSQQDASHQTPNNASQQSQASVHLRGGGSGTQSIRSHRSPGHGSPLVVNNSIVYNGVGSTPPLREGPPPARARDFWANLEAKQMGKASPKSKTKPATEPDPWGDIPASVIATDVDAKDKVDNWNGAGSGMPGSWDAANQANNQATWGASNGNVQDSNGAWPSAVETIATTEDTQNDNASDKNGKASDYNWGNDNGPQSGDQWKDSSDQANGNDNDWTGNSKSGDQQDDNWGNNDTNYDTQGNDGDAYNNDNGHDNNAWTADNAEVAPASSTGELAQDRKGSKAGSADKSGSRKPKATPSRPKARSSVLDWFKKKTPVTATTPVESKKASPPGSWSPPLPKSKKETSPKGAGPAGPVAEGVEAQVHSTSSLSTAPEAKPYWSTWRDSDTLTESTNPENDGVPAEAPLYTIPEEIVDRNKTTYQVRPDIPASYSHKLRSPKYMDTHEQPYAVFVFQYRDKQIIEEMFGTTIIEREIDEKQRLSSLSKYQLVEELMKATSRAGSNEGSGSRHSSDKATFRSNPYGIPNGPNMSLLTEKLNKLAGTKAPTPEKVGGWLDAGSENGNGKSDGQTWGEDTNHKKSDSAETWGAWGGNDTTNGNGGESSWNFDNVQNDEKGNAESWDNNGNANPDDDKKDHNAGGAWDNTNNDYTAGGSTWDFNDNNNETSYNQEDTNGGSGWGNDNNGASDKKDDAGTGASWGFDNATTGDTWENQDTKREDSKGRDEKKEDDWAASGLSDIGGGGGGGGGGW